MRGTPPKRPGTRARRNRIAGATVLELAPPSERRRVPPLPKRSRKPEWSKDTREQWKRAWDSPMAAEWLEADLGGLYMLADLWESFHRATEPQIKIRVAAEVRLHEQREVEKGETARAKTAKRRSTSTTVRDAGNDPRAALSQE
jgi:hypothetical protein